MGRLDCEIAGAISDALDRLERTAESFGAQSITAEARRERRRALVQAAVNYAATIRRIAALPHDTRSGPKREAAEGNVRQRQIGWATGGRPWCAQVDGDPHVL